MTLDLGADGGFFQMQSPFQIPNPSRLKDKGQIPAEAIIKSGVVSKYEDPEELSDPFPMKKMIPYETPVAKFHTHPKTNNTNPAVPS